MNAPSSLEVKNAGKVLEMLSNMEDISYSILRDDIFRVNHVDSGTSCVVDVEETIVCINAEVCDVPKNNPQDLYALLLKENGTSVHGKFAIVGDKIVCKDNLEIENLDRNEFEAAVAWVMAMVAQNIEEISGLINK